MAFGTGDHASTRICLKLLEKHIVQDSLVVDIGTGSGILAITAAKLGARRVVGVEIDEIAVRNAVENCRINRVASKVRIIHSAFEGKMRGRFDLGICNLLAHEMLLLIGDMTRILKGGNI